MNKFKKITLGLLGVALLTTGLYSCSNENDAINEQVIENSTFSARPSSDVIKKYYGKNLDVLKSINVNDDEGTYVLTKYVSPINEFTDVYSLTDAKGEIEFLIELDKKEERIKSTNIFASETDYIFKIGHIKGLKEVNFDLVAYIDFPIGTGRRFWGWSCTKGENTYNQLTGEVTGCSRTCVYSIMGNITSGPVTKGCDEQPQAPRIVSPDKIPGLQS